MYEKMLEDMIDVCQRENFDCVITLLERGDLDK